MSTSNRRVSVFVDAVNVTLNGGFGLRYDILRKFACRGGCSPCRLNVYLAVDRDRMRDDASYKQKTTRFSEVMRDFEYKVIEKSLSKYTDPESETVVTKNTVDIDMTVDMLTQTGNCDRIVLLSSDGGLVPVVQAIQARGQRVEVIGFDNVALALKREADLFISGYGIPGLLPIKSAYEWGTVGSRVRGMCYDFSHSDGYGFMRYLNKIDDNLWVTDSRAEDSPFRTVFAHVSQFESDFDTSFLPSRDLIFEFSLVKNDKGLVAEDIVLISAP
ncbi:MAG: NYN domain-containing protein [Bacteroidetes bacterium]|nr:NYN domain-containing protein [Bacteroidota bacterium]MCH8524802.1 NYN domain-containing protein [Balneolales bacterium]